MYYIYSHYTIISYLALKRIQTTCLLNHVSRLISLCLSPCHYLFFSIAHGSQLLSYYRFHHNPGILIKRANNISDSVVVSIPACHAGDLGSIPSQRVVSRLLVVVFDIFVLEEGAI